MIDLIDIAPSFSFVVGKGFELSANTYKPEEFGNATLLMTGLPFSLRFDRDRGQVFVDIGSDALGWYKLEYVLEFVNSSVTQQQLGEPPEPSILASLLHGGWDKVVDLFNNYQKMLKFKAFSEQKSTDFLSTLFGKS